MAHFAHLSDQNIVTQVIVLSNEVAPTEAAGQEFISNLRLSGVWKQTSYNTYRDENGTPQHRNSGTPFRGQYAGIGDRYDAELDEFVTPESDQGQ
jgi:hypothetical protein